jgi:hypothetical protein
MQRSDTQHSDPTLLKNQSHLVEEQKDHYLVLACGKPCHKGNHSSPLWESIDPQEEINPTYCGDMEEVIESKIMKHRYNVIYSESITDGIKQKRLDLLNSIATDDAIFIIHPGDPSRCFIPTASAYIASNPTYIIFKQISPEVFRKMKSLLQTEINSFHKKIILSILNKVDKMLQKNKLLLHRSIALFFLAHIQTYVENRLTRTLRNYFKDSKYQAFLESLEKIILKTEKLDMNHLISTIQYWEKQLPSSKTPPHKLETNYASLKYILQDFYAITRSSNQFNLSDKKIESKKLTR